VASPPAFHLSRLIGLVPSPSFIFIPSYLLIRSMIFFPATFAALVTALLVAGAPLRLRQEGSDNNVVTPVDPVAGDACGFGLTADSLAVKVSPEQYGLLLAVSPTALTF
jgi:hypothetical protein